VTDYVNTIEKYGVKFTLY